MARRIHHRRKRNVDHLDGGRGLELGVDALATYRLVRLLQRDTITEGLRARYLAKLGRRTADQIDWGALADCPWCLSIWIGLGVSLARAVAPRLWGKIAAALAFSAGAGVITGAVDRLEHADDRP